jgi:hypothetical protein
MAAIHQQFTLEQLYKAALIGLDSGVFCSLEKAAAAYDVSLSSVGHLKNSHQTQSIVLPDQQIVPSATAMVIG